MQPFQPSIADLTHRGIPFAVREHRIAEKNDERADKKHTLISKAKIDPAYIAKRNAEWKAMLACGMTPPQIADQYGVAPTTVRRVTGGSYKRAKTTYRRIRIEGVLYESQTDAMKRLHVSREKLMRWLSEGRAKYIKER